MNLPPGRVAAFFIVIAISLAQPIARVPKGFLTVQKYLELGTVAQGTFAMGFVDGMLMAPMFDASDQNGQYLLLSSCVVPMTPRQIAAIIEKYGKEHPERWDEPVHGLAYGALIRACSAKH